MEYKEDLRIQKTRRDLRGAIIELIKQKPIEKISVKEICDTALITRMTFYKYYEDKYQLLDDTFIEIKDQILASVPTQEVTSIEDATKYTCELITTVINFIQKNFDIIQALKKNSNNEIMEMITNISEGAISELLNKASEIRPLRYPIPMTSSFVFGGFMGTLNYWLEHPSDENFKNVNLLVQDVKNNILKPEFLYK